MNPQFSLVIPTHNRLDILPEVLDPVEAQVDAPSFDLVIVDDGSSDGTAEYLASRSFALPTQVIRQENAGPAAARNAGVQAASGHRLAFLGDDTVPAPGWLKAHDEAHKARGGGDEIAVIGYTRWHSRMKPTPFLDWINDYGLQFGYALIDDPENVPFNFFYTSNLSLSRQKLLEEPFDLRFPFPAWEDIEVSYRLSQAGQRLVYESQAIVDHDHPTDIARFTRRQEKAGYSAVVFYRLHPELGTFLGLDAGGPPPLPGRLRHWVGETVVRSLQKSRMRLPRLWDEVLRYHYLVGLHMGWIDGAGLDRQGGRR